MSQVIILHERRFRLVIRLTENASQYIEKAVDFVISHWNNSTSPTPNRNIMLEAQNKNNKTFVIVTQEPGNKIRGVVECYAIAKNAMVDLLNGTIDESEIKSSDLIRQGIAPQMGLYVAITCPPFHSLHNGKCVLAALYGTLLNVKSGYLHDGEKNIELWAIDASTKGASLMEKQYIGFAVERELSKNRLKNGHHDRVWHKMINDTVIGDFKNREWSTHLRQLVVVDTP